MVKLKQIQAIVCITLAAATVGTQVPAKSGSTAASGENQETARPSAAASSSSSPQELQQLVASLALPDALNGRLGDAYFNYPQGVMNAIQAPRKQASDAGTFKTTPFIVNQDGKIYQKDLAPRVEEITESITAYSHDRTWRFVE